jgi:protein-arginine kinase activator protein McsA
MLCLQCKKNQATKTYEQIKNGVNQTEYYCLDCYHRLFLCQQEAEGEVALSACPYCGTKAEEIKKTKMVGCAYCYHTLEKTVWQEVLKMQGAEAHKGKHPTLEDGLDAIAVGERGKKEAVEKTKFQRRCRELKMLIERLRKDGDKTGAERYEAKLLQMEQTNTIEEGFVWQENPTTTI